MKKKSSLLYLLFTLLLAACSPNYNYRVVVPQGWSTCDTVMNGLKVKLIYGPKENAADAPAANVVIVHANMKGIEELTTENINTLCRDMAGIVYRKRGRITVGGIDARWFTYDKTFNGLTRNMVCYLIPLHGFAYIITGGVNDGAMDRYRATFDSIAQSFRG